MYNPDVQADNLIFLILKIYKIYKINRYKLNVRQFLA